MCQWRLNNGLRELKAKYPEVFSLNNEDTGHTQLVTMDIDTGDSPPVCQNHIHFPSNIILGVQQEIETLEWAWSHQKEHQSMGQSYCCCA